MSEKCPRCRGAVTRPTCPACGTGCYQKFQCVECGGTGKLYRSTAAEQLADSTLICKCGREHRVVTYKDKLTAANAVVEAARNYKNYMQSGNIRGSRVGELINKLYDALDKLKRR